MTIRDDELQELLDRANDDAGLRAELISQPRRVLERELGLELPEDAEVRVIEERANQLHLILPERGDVELTDDDLDAVAGGLSRSFARRPGGLSYS